MAWLLNLDRSCEELGQSVLRLDFLAHQHGACVAKVGQDCSRLHKTSPVCPRPSSWTAFGTTCFLRSTCSGPKLIASKRAAAHSTRSPLRSRMNSPGKVGSSQLDVACSRMKRRTAIILS